MRLADKVHKINELTQLTPKNMHGVKRVHESLNNMDEVHEWVKYANNDKKGALGGQQHSLGARRLKYGCMECMTKV